MRRVLGLWGFAVCILIAVNYVFLWLKIYLHPYFPLGIVLGFVTPFILFPAMLLAGVNRECRGAGRREYWQRFFRPMPQWIRHMTHIIFGLMMLNFMGFWFTSVGKPVPTTLDGEYVMTTAANGKTIYFTIEEARTHNLGEVVVMLKNTPVLRSYSNGYSSYVEMSEAEHRDSMIKQGLMMSGHLLVFTWIPAIYFWFPRQTRAKESLEMDIFQPIRYQQK
ncbi:MAG: hypothetical protein H6673_10875 [Anaerolineales bacterium]|nr:hypothetical protein [Anaerolineales bacterium]